MASSSRSVAFGLWGIELTLANCGRRELCDDYALRRMRCCARWLVVVNYSGHSEY